MTIHKPLHPGTIVNEVLLDESTGLNVTTAAKALGVDRTTLSRLLNGKAGISPEMAIRLSLLLGTSAKTWLNLQRDYDLSLLTDDRKRIKIKPLKKAA